MNSSARRMFFSGFFFWVVIAAVCIFFIWPMDKTKIKRGIDLIGGSYLTLEVQTEKAIDAELLAFLQSVPKILKNADKTLPKKKEVKDQKIILTFENLNEAQEAAVQLRGIKDMQLSTQGSQVVLQYTKARAAVIKKDAVLTNIDVLRSRLDSMSVAEIGIATEGEKNIIVELPGVTDSMAARAMIGKPAMLEFKLIERSDSSIENIEYEYDGEIPDDMEILPGKVNKKGDRRYHLVPKYSDITGKDLVSVRSRLGGSISMQYVVGFQFTSEGGEKFYELTSRNIGRHLAAVLDGRVITDANINSAIRTEGYIEGDFTSESAKELARLLRSGALKAPMKIEGEQQIGPTLGAEYIKQGFISCLVGLGLLLVFGIFYYSISGLFAFIALMFNLCLVLFGLYLIGGVLTLPGIAGMVLTIGMAIDASILIYERIKDALKTGLSIKNAVNTGFSNAMHVILDANVTTLVVGFVLYRFGTGPLQGFAVTMILGIIATLITGLFFLRSLFNFVLDNFNVQKLRI